MGFTNKFRKDPDNGLVSGVCAGMANLLGVDRKWVRVAVLIGLLISPLATAILYLLACVILPPQCRWLD